MTSKEEDRSRWGFAFTVVVRRDENAMPTLPGDGKKDKKGKKKAKKKKKKMMKKEGEEEEEEEEEEECSRHPCDAAGANQLRRDVISIDARLHPYPLAAWRALVTTDWNALRNNEGEGDKEKDDEEEAGEAFAKDALAMTPFSPQAPFVERLWASEGEEEGEEGEEGKVAKNTTTLAEDDERVYGFGFTSLVDFAATATGPWWTRQADSQLIQW